MDVFHSTHPILSMSKEDKEFDRRLNEDSPREGNEAPEIVVRDRRFWARKDTASDAEQSRSRLPTVFEKMLEKIERGEVEIREIRERAREFKAETEAIRLRMERDQQRKLENLKSQFLRDVIDIFDNLERSVKAGHENPKDEKGVLSLLEGIAMVQQLFEDRLRKEGIEKVPLAGEVFDPHWAEAIDVSPTPDPAMDNRIMEVFQEGYRIEERVLRPGRVRVARFFAEDSAPKDTNDSLNKKLNEEERNKP